LVLIRIVQCIVVRNILSNTFVYTNGIISRFPSRYQFHNEGVDEVSTDGYTNEYSEEGRETTFFLVSWCGHDRCWKGNKLYTLFACILMCNVISGSGPPFRAQFTASSTTWLGKMMTFISSPNKLGLELGSLGFPSNLKATSFMPGCIFFKKN